MPFIRTTTNVSVSDSAAEKIRQQLGQAIRLIPGKSEQWLMITLEPGCTVYFRGDKEEPAAFVQVGIYGKASAKAYDDLTGAVTGILQEELCIPPDRIYIQYAETPYWGYNGRNF